MAKKSLVYFQSGGPTTVINSSLLGVVNEAKRHNEIDGIFGSMYGVEGLIEDNLIDLRAEDQSDLELLKHTPGAILGSTRRKMPGIEDPLFDKIIWTIQKHNIGYILVNGGNDSMDTCHRLSQFFLAKKMPVQVIGIPKTIDNDLELTDHALGYPSAAKHIINFVSMIVQDAKTYRKGKIILIEIMGRDTGWLTASVDLLPEDRRPDFLYLPEMPWDEAKFLKEVKNTYETQGYIVCAVSEGVPVQHINENIVDSFGHKALEGCCVSVASLIKEKLGYSSRVVELSISQRADPLLASEVDIEEAIGAGSFAVQALLKGEKDKMVCLRRVSDCPYEASYVLENVGEVANKIKYVPSEFMQSDRRMSDAFRDYLRPLLGLDYLYTQATFKFRKAK
jgi:6-phosphofructokinase